MIAGFQSWANNIYNRVRRVHEVVRVPENSGLTVRQQQTGRKALKILGIEETEGLNKQELVIFLYAVGLNPTDDVIDSKLRSFKLHDAEKLTFGHVCHIWHSMLQDLTDEEEILRRAFQFFDKDGNGEISIPELRTTMHELGDLLSEEEILAFMAVMDVNNDGVIGFEEFISTLKTQTPELIPDDELGDDGGDDYTTRGGPQLGGGGEQAMSPRGARSARPSASINPRARASTGEEGEAASASQQPQQLQLRSPQHPQQGAAGRGQAVGEATTDAGTAPSNDHGRERWRTVHDVPAEISGCQMQPAALRRGDTPPSMDEDDETEQRQEQQQQRAHQQQQQREQSWEGGLNGGTTAKLQCSLPLSHASTERTGRREAQLAGRAIGSPGSNGVMLIPASSPSKARASPRLTAGSAPLQ